MTTFTMTLRATLAALCLGAFGCNGSLGDATESGSATDSSTSGNTGNTSNDPTDGGGDFGFCSNNNPCPDGQFCFNGICAIGCQSDGDCADNQYCATDGDGLCHNKQVSTCPETPCAESQMCVNGFCSTPPPSTQCDPTSLPDGCEANAFCAEIEEGQPKCYTLPYCAEDDTCPTGTEGAVCNVDLIPGKDKICLIGLCTSASNCPAEWKCVKFEPNGVIGYCSSGGPGSECNSDDECLSGNCDAPFPGIPGVCL